MSILVDLIRYFRDKENIATRGLESVLKRPDVRAGLNEFLESRFNWPLTITRIKAQVAQGANGQPDLEAKDDGGHTIAFFEVKFEADLTCHQPVSYLNALPPGGLLLFIAPQYRRTVLWREILGALGRQPEYDSTCRLEVNGKYLALTTGFDLLNALSQATREPEALSDIRQLQALWAAYDSPDLPPIDEAISADQGLANIIHGLAKLPNKVANSVSLPPDAIVGRTETYATGCVYTFLQIRELDGWVIYSPPNWREYGQSPIWFETWERRYDDRRKIWPALIAAFVNFAGQEPFASMSSPNYPGVIAVPLNIPNAIESAVLADISDQLCALAKGLDNILPHNPDA